MTCALHQSSRNKLGLVYVNQCFVLILTDRSPNEAAPASLACMCEVRIRNGTTRGSENGVNRIGAHLGSLTDLDNKAATMRVLGRVDRCPTAERAGKMNPL